LGDFFTPTASGGIGKIPSEPDPNGHSFFLAGLNRHELHPEKEAGDRSRPEFVD
jgi:hypothetical protein